LQIFQGKSATTTDSYTAIRYCPKNLLKDAIISISTLQHESEFQVKPKETNSNVKLNLKEDTSESEVSDSAEIQGKSC
jgi:hypothetical protein